MSSASQPDWRLIAGFMASALVHVAIAAAIGGVGMTGNGAADEAPPAVELAPPKIRPGLDQSRAVTINWIGFEDPTPHEARESATDQPSLVRGPAPQPSPETAPAAPQTPPPVPLAEAADAQPVPALPLPPTTIDDLLARLEQDTSATSTAAPPPVPPAPPTKPVEAPSVNEERPAPAAKPGGGPSEASPTAQKKPTEVHPGRPIAIQGLEIETAAPKFSAITRFTAMPSNPHVRIVFDTTGKVVTAEILLSSGYANVDRPILDAIYTWRAKGEQLDTLRAEDPEQRIELEFRIVLQ